MKALVIIPTYNEIHNIKELIRVILDLYPDINILVVDDNSPDGTANYIQELSEKDSRIFLIKRSGKLGLGTAYVEGFKFMLKNNYDVAIQMDADFSHDPKEIKNFLEKIKDYDWIIGSRYINGVRVINWPIKIGRAHV